MSEQLEFDILVKQNQLTKTLDDAASKAKTVTDLINETSQAVAQAGVATDGLNGSMGSFLSTTLAVAAGQFVFRAIAEAIQFIKSSLYESVAAYSAHEDAINKLKQSFILTGGASQSAVQGVEDFANGLEKTSKFSAENVTRNVAFVKSLGASTQASKDMVQAAANLSAVIGGSLDENTEKLGKTLSGLTGRLAQYVPELKSLTKEQLQAGDAARIINEKFSGSASNDLNTYSGSMAALSNSFTKLKEVTGEAIVKSDIFASAIKFAKKVVDDYNDTSSVNSVLLGYTSDGQSKVSKTSSQLALDFKTLDDKTASLNTELKRLTENGGDLNIVSISEIKKQIAELDKIKDEIEEKLKYSRNSTQEKADIAAPKQLNESEIENIKKTKAEIFAINEKAAAENKTAKIKEVNDLFALDDINKQLEIQRIYEFEAKKVQIDAELKLKSISANTNSEQLKLDRQKIQDEKELQLLTLKNKKESDLNINKLAVEKKQEEEANKFKITNMQNLGSETAASFNLIGTLAKQGSQEQYYIQKAAAVAQIGFQYAVGQMNAAVLMTNPATFAAGVAAESYVNIMSGIALATVAAQTIQGLATGGVVGYAMGASMGEDNTIIKARDGEMMLNADQQKKLFDGINSGGLVGGQIIIQIDGRTIATAVRDEVRRGFKLS